MRRQDPLAAPIGRDDADWDELVRVHEPRLRRKVAKRVGDPALVEEVVQDTFAQAYRRWSTYDQSRPVWPWLAAIAVNLACRRGQAELRVVETATDDVLAEAPLLDYIGAAGSDDHVANLDRRAAMRAALDGMTARHRRALLRWELERRSATELAASEGMTPEELRATVVRARRNLRRRYLAAAGEGPFAGATLGLGLGGLAARWRERVARIASAGGWAEAASAFAAAPAMAVAGMAMITLMPAPTSGGAVSARLAEQPIAMVQGASITEVPVPTQVPASVTARPRTDGDLPSAAPPPNPTQPPAPTLAAGPAAASVTSSANAKQTALDLDGPTGGTEWNHRSETYCESVVADALCQVRQLVPPAG